MANFKECYVDFTQEAIPPQFAQTTNAIATAADNQVDFLYTQDGHYFEWIQAGQNDDIFMTKNTSAPTGWVIPNDNTANDGIEITQGINATAAVNYLAYTVGTDAAFRLDVKMRIPDVSDYDVAFVGFRKAAAYTAALQAPAELLTDYTDIAGINVNAGAHAVNTRLNSGTGVATVTGDTVADGVSVTLSVLVSAAGVTTFLIDGSAPTATYAHTFDDTDVLIPTVCFTKGGNSSDTPPILETYSCKFQ